MLRSPPPQPDPLALLVALPLVALLAMAAQALLGLRTFGLYLPLLLSLSFVQVGLPAGLAVIGAASAVGFVLRELLGTISLRSIARLAALLVALATLLLVADLLDGGRIVDYSALTAAFPLAAALVVESGFGRLRNRWVRFVLGRAPGGPCCSQPWAARCWSPNPC